MHLLLASFISGPSSGARSSVTRQTGQDHWPSADNCLGESSRWMKWRRGNRPLFTVQSSGSSVKGSLEGLNAPLSLKCWCLHVSRLELKYSYLPHLTPPPLRHILTAPCTAYQAETGITQVSSLASRATGEPALTCVCVCVQ